MSSDRSVTRWLEGVKAGDEEAARQLWQRYYMRLVALARRILEDAPRRGADEEDVALSALKSFCWRAAAGRFPRLHDRDDLWKLLMTMTVRKAIDVRRTEARAAGVEIPDDLLDRLSAEPDPEVATVFADQLRHLFDLLDDDQLKEIVVMKLEGHTNNEIAHRFNRHVTFTERKLQLIRKIWSKEFPP